jgi:hypothetical protein
MGFWLLQELFCVPTNPHPNEISPPHRGEHLQTSGMTVIFHRDRQPVFNEPPKLLDVCFLEVVL